MARPLSFDKRKVLAIIERQFRQSGYAGTSLDDIASASQLGRGSLYAAFGDKHQLFLRTLHDYCDHQEAAVAASLEGPDDTALQRLHDYLIGNLRNTFDDPDLLGCMAGRFALELGRSDTEAAQRIGQAFAAQRDALQKCCAAAQRHGDLDPAVNPQEIAAMLLALARGIDVMARGGTDENLMKATALRALAGLPTTAQGQRTLERLT
ncbi:TetR/AcrR family transcriptional regulator [Nonomuraea fuscirosea]|uniref:TetR/AcrR family transcriptional regulator n=1 Tax=Nonomuraea fuscirosea TaxID=1291556 RepID=UPI002DD893A2|nr:TetR/AcrR family transcriptional regulator [Nonomuraea fuscirosea]WSA49980.1 TetR/AcrR family transcriptional regulator [Nonomuraea fuscirosea]